MSEWTDEYDQWMLLEHIRRQDKQIAEWQSDSVNVRGAMKAKDKQIAELEKALAICESEYRKVDKQIAEAYIDGEDDETNRRVLKRAAEQYYNETYGSDK